MSADNVDTNSHPLNVVAKEKLEQFNFTINPKTTHIMNLIHSLEVNFGVGFETKGNVVDSHIIDYLWVTDPSVIEFLLCDYEDELIDMILDEIRSIDDIYDLRNYLMLDLLFPAIRQRSNINIL